MTGLTQSAVRRRKAAELLERQRGPVTARVVDALSAVGNPVVLDEESRKLFVDHMNVCLDAVFADLLSAPFNPVALGNPLSGYIGWIRAKQGVRPEDSMRASLVFSEIAASSFLAELGRAGLATEVAPAMLSSMHRNVAERVVTATVRYMDYLLDDIQTTHREERRRVSREIHDRVANEVSTAYRNLELCEVMDDSRGGDVDARVEATRQAFVAAMVAIDEINTELRSSVIRNSLEATLREYCAGLGPAAPEIRLHFAGDESPLSEELRDEVFLVVREAIRNAIQHAQATRLTVDVRIDRTALRCSVADDGVGFTPAAVIGAPGHSGLLSMHERAEEARGHLTVVSRPGHGTSVTLTAPLG
jgi:signal transduction histidine kinase